MKNYEQYKRIIRFVFFLTVLSLEMVSYWYVWKHSYNPLNCVDNLNYEALFTKTKPFQE